MGLGAIVDREENGGVGEYPGDGAEHYAPFIRVDLTFGHGRHS